MSDIDSNAMTSECVLHWSLPLPHNSVDWWPDYQLGERPQLYLSNPEKQREMEINWAPPLNPPKWEVDSPRLRPVRHQGCWGCLVWTLHWMYFTKHTMNTLHPLHIVETWNILSIFRKRETMFILLLLKKLHILLTLVSQAGTRGA